MFVSKIQIITAIRKLCSIRRHDVCVTLIMGASTLKIKTCRSRLMQRNIKKKKITTLWRLSLEFLRTSAVQRICDNIIVVITHKTTITIENGWKAFVLEWKDGCYFSDVTSTWKRRRRPAEPTPPEAAAIRVAVLYETTAIDINRKRKQMTMSGGCHCVIYSDAAQEVGRRPPKFFLFTPRSSVKPRERLYIIIITII